MKLRIPRSTLTMGLSLVALSAVISACGCGSTTTSPVPKPTPSPTVHPTTAPTTTPTPVPTQTPIVTPTQSPTIKPTTTPTPVRTNPPPTMTPTPTASPTIAPTTTPTPSITPCPVGDSCVTIVPNPINLTASNPKQTANMFGGQFAFFELSNDTCDANGIANLQIFYSALIVSNKVGTFHGKNGACTATIIDGGDPSFQPGVVYVNNNANP